MVVGSHRWARVWPQREAGSCDGHDCDHSRAACGDAPMLTAARAGVNPA